MVDTTMVAFTIKPYPNFHIVSKINIKTASLYNNDGIYSKMWRTYVLDTFKFTV